MPASLLVKSSRCRTTSVRHHRVDAVFASRYSGFFFGGGATSALFIGTPNFVPKAGDGPQRETAILPRFLSGPVLITLCLGSLSGFPCLPLSLGDLADCSYEASLLALVRGRVINELALQAAAGIWNTFDLTPDVRPEKMVILI